MNEGREALIELKDLTISYEGRPAVEDVSLQVYRGENLCLVGANGSGKSTLIMGILGLIKPDKGHVSVKNGLGSVAYLAQMNTAEKQFPATAWEIILSGTQVSSRRLPFYTRKDKENARRAAARTRVEHLVKKRIGDMSGGEQQRVLIARALARNPEILILDEPCSALDPDITQELYALFDSLKEEDGLTLIISTHDWPYVRRSADRVLMINKKVEYLGPVNHWIGGQEGLK